MLWGYFFSHRERAPLEVAATRLQGEGYTVVGIREDEDGHSFWLHVERVKTHSLQSLREKLRAFDTHLCYTKQINPLAGKMSAVGGEGRLDPALFEDW